MHTKGRFPNALFSTNLRPNSAALAIMILLLFLLFVFLFLTLTAQPAQAQTFTVLHSFTGGADGAYPPCGLTMDATGNLYGTTYSGGAGLCSLPPGCGTVFKLTHTSLGWLTTLLYQFQGRSDGAHPLGGVTIAADGSLYGTTYAGYGTLFRLTSPRTPQAWPVSLWNITVLYTFGTEGALGELVFDAHGNVYGTLAFGGYGYGVIYQWTGSTFNVLFAPQHSSDPNGPEGGVTFDQSGNLYGIFSAGGPYQSGAVYELSPSPQGWQEQILYNFPRGGYAPVSGLIIDSQGNLYGRKGGGIFELVHVGSYWNIAWIYDTGSSTSPDELVMDSAGNLYGTASANGAYGMGSVFKLTPSQGGWTYTSLHDFTGGSDGAAPVSNVVFDGNGNLYGTASSGGAYGYGVVWEITP